MAEKRVIKTTLQEEAQPQEQNNFSLRPNNLDEYIGQEKIKKMVSIAISSAKKRNAPLGHVLFYGAPGLGKTTIANLIAKEMGSDITTIVGSNIEKAGDVASVLCRLKENDILFIDEIHRVPKPCEEVLYSAMEDGFITITIGAAEQAKTVKLDLPSFTLIGATTEMGSLSAPLRDRFSMECKMEFYTDEELATIVELSANRIELLIPRDASLMIARASRETPRIANRILLQTRDYAVSSNEPVDKNLVKEVFDTYGITKDGIDKTDIDILKVLLASDGAGLNTIAKTIGEDTKTIELAKEPFLLRKQYIEITPRGRALTEKGREYLLTLA